MVSAKKLASILCTSHFIITYGQSPNVGIGTTSPQSRLHIVAPSGYTFPLLQVETDGSAGPYLIILPDGKVGIGIANPSEALDISGNVQFSGALMPGGNAGNAGFVLTSQGPGGTPTWTDPATFGDNWGSQVAQTQSPIVGDGTAADPITLGAGTIPGQVWKWDGTQWVLANDDWGNQVAVTQVPIVGNGTSANPIGLQSGTNAGEVLIWDGSQWAIKPSPFDSVCNIATANYVIKWTGSELCNSIIYDNGMRIGIGTNNPIVKLDVIDSVVIGSSGSLPNGVVAELHVGRQLVSSGTAGEVSRLAIQPYGNTGGPFTFVARDTGQYVNLDIRFGNEVIMSIQKDTLSGFRGIGIGEVSQISPFVLDVAKRTNGVVTDPTTMLARFSLLDSNSSADATLLFYGYPNADVDYLDSTFMIYTPHMGATKNLQFVANKSAGQIRFHIGGFQSSTTEIMNIQSVGVGIKTSTFNNKCSICPLQVNGRMMLRRFDAVYMSGWDGVPQNYHLIGTYMGWDREAIYIGGYNYYRPENNDTLKSYAKRLRIGGGGVNPTNQVVVEFNNGSLGIGTIPTEKLDVAGNIRSSSAFTVSVNGCGNNICSYTVNFPVPFSTPPVVNITAGPNANTNWGPLIPLVRNVTTTSVTFVLDSADPAQAITGTKTIHIIAIAP